jgi:hypothetical protein
VCYTRIEGILNSLCHAAKGQQNLPLSLGDLKGSGIRRAKRYLTRLAGVSEPFQTSDWRQLTNYNELRNVLVHGEGVLQDTSQHQTLRGFVDRHQLLDLDDNGFIIIRQGFCEEVVYAAHCFFAEFPYELIVAVSPDGV